MSNTDDLVIGEMMRSPRITSPAQAAELFRDVHYLIGFSECFEVTQQGRPIYDASQAALLAAISVAYPDVPAQDVYDVLCDCWEPIEYCATQVRDAMRRYQFRVPDVGTVTITIGEPQRIDHGTRFPFVRVVIGDNVIMQGAEWGLDYFCTDMDAALALLRDAANESSNKALDVWAEDRQRMRSAISSGPYESMLATGRAVWRGQY